MSVRFPLREAVETSWHILPGVTSLGLRFIGTRRKQGIRGYRRR